MANEKNLKHFTSEQSHEKAVKNGKKGGINSGIAKREKKTMREMLDYLLEKEITNNKGEKETTLEAMLTATIKKAIQGDIRAVEFIRNTIGQKPIDKQELNGNIVATLEEPSIDKVKELKRLFDE